MPNPPSERMLQFSTRGTNRPVCYEVQHQATPDWCVAASVEMVLDFYRYQYPQERLAAALGLGTPSNPNGLPTGMESKVVSVIENMTSNMLRVAIVRDPTWADIRDEIVANRPVILFLSGHARTIAGYRGPSTVPSPLSTPPRLCVYDPSPPAMSGGRFWESATPAMVDNYTFAFLARLQLA